MTLIRFLILLFIAFVCGSVGARIAGSGGKGCFTSIILGFIGALIGSWLSGKLGIDDLLYFKNIPVFWSIIGAAVFVAVINLISGSSGRK
ncbi:MAG: GlsB/YeaQ/YmgE family stress response membrane protein [Candidatus Aminicenantes bacterium]|nr:GlsB/YeaQ/YmgE family stress response membrane protein [Candidatus Aminicenantes bacterium]